MVRACAPLRHGGANQALIGLKVGADAEQSSVKPIVLLAVQLAAADTVNFEELGRMAAATKAVATTLPPSAPSSCRSQAAAGRRHRGGGAA